MNIVRRAILAFATVAGIVPAIAQVPPPVPALPDTERRTSFSISASTCACNVGFALYGDSTDYQNWVEVYLNGIRLNFNDPVFGWTITSPTGPLGNIPRPITDAVMTFTNPQTGVVQIVGARRPRRASQFNENSGISARNFNQVLTDIISQNREIWDKTNDFTGRALISQPGVILGLLPVPSVCANGFLGFDPTGLIPVCRTSSGTGNVLLPVTSGDLACFNGTAGQMDDCGLPPLSPVTPHTEDFLTGTNFTPGVTTSLTLSSTPIATDLLAITFDGIAQSQNTWSLSGATVTFNAAIPTNTQVVEARWSSTVTAGTVVSSINSLTGPVTFSSLTGMITQTGQNIAISLGNYLSSLAGAVSRTVTLKLADFANLKDFGAVCDGVTDDNVALNQAMTSMPSGSTLYLPNSLCGSSVTITRTAPITIIGQGMNTSGLIALSTMPATSTLFFVNPPNGVTSRGYSFTNMLFDAPFGSTAVVVQSSFSTTSLAEVVFDKVNSIASSSNTNNFGLQLVNSSAPNGGIFNFTFKNGIINGGANLVNAGDTLRFQNNIITGPNAGIGGSQVSGAGNLLVEGNNCSSAAGCVVLGCALSPRIFHNEFEQQVANTESNDAIIDLTGAVCSTDGASITENQVQAVSGIGTPILVHVGSNVTNVKLDSNRLATPTAYTGVDNSSPSLLCGNNEFATGTPHIGGTAAVATWGNGC
jgi:Pectate lyase superfamily protein